MSLPRGSKRPHAAWTRWSRACGAIYCARSRSTPSPPACRFADPLRRMSRYDAWISLVLPVLRCDMIGKLFADLRFHNQQNFLFPPGQIAHLHEITPTGTLMANQSAVSRDEGEELPEGATIPSLPPSGPRKLVRPSLPEGVKKRRSYSRRDTP